MLDTQESADQVTVRLSGELTIQHADLLKSGLMEALARNKPTALDLAAVTELDSAGVQLLYYAKQAARKLGLELHLQQHSAAVVEVFELYRLATQFGDPMVLQANDQLGAQS